MRATDDAVVTDEGYVLTTYDEIAAAREAHANGETLSVDELDRELFNELREPVDPQPLKLTRGAARRLAFQLLDQRLREAGVPRRTRREILFKKPRGFDINAMARTLTGLQS